MWRWIGYPLTSVGDQSSPKLTPKLFAGLRYTRNRSIDWDLFCGGSSARLPPTPHAHKMDSRPRIIIYAASHNPRQNMDSLCRGTHIFARISHTQTPVVITYVNNSLPLHTFSDYNWELPILGKPIYLRHNQRHITHTHRNTVTRASFSSLIQLLQDKLISSGFLITMNIVVL